MKSENILPLGYRVTIGSHMPFFFLSFVYVTNFYLSSNLKHSLCPNVLFSVSHCHPLYQVLGGIFQMKTLFFREIFLSYFFNESLSVLFLEFLLSRIGSLIFLFSLLISSFVFLLYFLGDFLNLIFQFVYCGFGGRVGGGLIFLFLELSFLL